MKIEIKNIPACLNEVAYLRLVRRFKKIKQKLIIVFDNRIKGYGQYTYNSKKRIHTIRISPKINSDTDKVTERYHYLSTTLHELKHSQQKEIKGSIFWSTKYRRAADIKNEVSADFFSECELDARAYEAQNTARAVSLYNKYLLQIKP